jgi:hypothetical protein
MGLELGTHWWKELESTSLPVRGEKLPGSAALATSLSLAVTGHQARRAESRRTDPLARSVLIGAIRHAGICSPVGEL